MAFRKLALIPRRRLFEGEYLKWNTQHRRLSPVWRNVFYTTTQRRCITRCSGVDGVCYRTIERDCVSAKPCAAFARDSWIIEDQILLEQRNSTRFALCSFHENIQVLGCWKTRIRDNSPSHHPLWWGRKEIELCGRLNTQTHTHTHSSNIGEVYSHKSHPRASISWIEKSLIPSPSSEFTSQFYIRETDVGH